MYMIEMEEHTKLAYDLDGSEYTWITYSHTYIIGVAISYPSLSPQEVVAYSCTFGMEAVHAHTTARFERETCTNFALLYLRNR